MFSTVLVALLWVAIACGAVNGRGEDLTAGALEGAKAAVELCLAMGGSLCLWSGVLEVLRRSGALGGLSRLLRPLLTRLFPSARRDTALLEDLSANISANLLGLGNAATPPGLSAARRLARHAPVPGAAGAELSRLVVLNSASVQLLPTTVAALMAGAGSTDPFAILPAVWITSLVSVSAGLLAARLLGGRA